MHTPGHVSASTGCNWFMVCVMLQLYVIHVIKLVDQSSTVAAQPAVAICVVGSYVVGLSYNVYDVGVWLYA